MFSIQKLGITEISKLIFCELHCFSNKHIDFKLCNYDYLILLTDIKKGMLYATYIITCYIQHTSGHVIYNIHHVMLYTTYIISKLLYNIHANDFSSYFTFLNITILTKNLIKKLLLRKSRQYTFSNAFNFQNLEPNPTIKDYKSIPNICSFITRVRDLLLRI